MGGRQLVAGYGGVITSQITIAPSWNGRVNRSAGPNGCWPWTGGLMTNGYGQTRVKENGRWRGAGAHQVAHYLATGRWERGADGRLVRHLCHNRRCCNPAHLAGGTPQENADDRVALRQGRDLIGRSPYVLPVAGAAVDWHPSQRTLDGGMHEYHRPWTEMILRGEAA